MDTDRFQASQYVYDPEVGAYRGTDYGYDASTGQYREDGNGYAAAAQAGQYGGNQYQPPADDNRLYGRAANPPAGYDWPAGDPRGYRNEPPPSQYGPGYGGGYQSGYGPGYGPSNGGGYDSGAGGYRSDPLTGQLPSSGYGGAAGPQYDVQPPAEQYRSSAGYPDGGPGPGYQNGGPATGYVNGPPTGYVNGPPGGYPNGYGYPAEPQGGQFRNSGYGGAAPVQYAPAPPPMPQAPAAPPMRRNPPGAPEGWYRPNRPAEPATDLLPPITETGPSTEEGEIVGGPRTEEGTIVGPRTVEGEIVDGPVRSSGDSPNTELARLSDVAAPSIEDIIKPRRRQDARSEGRISEAMQRRLIILVGLAGAAATMWMWWLGSFEGSIDSNENLVAGVAQIAGMMGEYLILIQVLLMARVPWLERAIGTEYLTRVHVIIGFSVMAFITEHIIGAVILNMPTGSPPLQGISGVFLGLRDVLTASAGTALMFGVVYLSTKRVRARIPYEVWRYLHLFVYVGIMLEFIHQMTLGIHFLNSKAAYLYWVAIHGFTLFCVAWYRFGVIIRMNLRHRLRVDSVVPEGPGVYSIYFAGNRLDKFNGTAGQFCRWRFMNREGWWQSHPFSLSAAPTPKYLRITVKQLGDWTNLHLPELEPGTPVVFSGPYGGLTPERRKRRKVLLVAAGIGITPMRSLLAGLPADPGDITLLYRASSEQDLVFREELDELARQRGATVHYLIGPREKFKGGDPLGAAQLKELVPGLHRHDVYLCGPEGMLSAAIEGLRKARVPRRQIHTERFGF